MKTKTYSTLQKTYDQSHLTCSTAVYYESQGNEVEALRCWRECLAQLQGNNTGSYRPRTETERTLLQSLKTMQNQCQDRVGLLQAVLVSKMDAENNGQGRRNSRDDRKTASSLILPPANTAIHITIPPTPPTLPPIPTSLPRSSLRPQLGHTFQPISTATHDNDSRLSRTSSPEKRSFLSTLRSSRKGRKDESSPKFEGATAVKAATLAWSSISRAQGTVLSHTLLVPLVDYPSIKQNEILGSASDFPREQRPSTAISNQGPSPSHMISDQPDLSSTKRRPHSTIISFGNTAQSSFKAGHPTPPPHKYLLGPSCATFSKSIVTLQSEEIPQSYSKFKLDPLIPPISPLSNSSESIVKPPKLTHLNLSVPRKPTPSVVRRTPFGQGNPEQIIGAFSENLYEGSHRKQGQDDDPKTTSGSGGNISNNKLEIEGIDRVTEALKRISKDVDMQAALQVANEIVVRGDEVKWDDVSGLDAAKLALKEAVIYPFLRPDLFSGLREPARGMLLFGPPGTGKTMLARAVATESKSTFFSISASSLTSKYLGESEKLVRALFALAKALAPSIIFVDEIDSLLSSRNSEGEHEATRRIKTEFLIQWSDLAKAVAEKEPDTGDASRVLVLAATNLPWAIDDAARRRFVRRQYIPLPEGLTRERQLLRLLSNQKHRLSQVEMERLIKLTDGFSGSDITALTKDAAMGPLRSLGEALLYMKKDDIRPITFSDFEASLSSIRPSVSKEGLQAFEDWAKKYGERV